MSNKYLSQVLYNEEFKKGFLNTYGVIKKKEEVQQVNLDKKEEEEEEDNKKKKKKKDEDKKTSLSYRYIFQKSFNTETQLGKDIYDFNDAELNTLMHSYGNGSVYTVSSNVSILRQYLDYCVQKGYIRVNLLQDLSGYDDFEKFIDKNAQKNKYIDRVEFERIIEDCINYQDAYSIAMLYYGFKGEEYCELTNLKIEHVNRIAGTIYIENRDTTFEIDEFLMDIIIGAINEDEYKKSLTEGKDAPRSSGFKIHPNDYVMRVANSEDNLPAKSNNVGSRLKRVKMYTGNAYIIPISIWYSGMLDQARQVYDDKGELTKEDWISIGKMYGVLPIYWSKTKQRFEKMLNGNNEE